MCKYCKVCLITSTPDLTLCKTHLCCRWSTDGSHIVSGSDDLKVPAVVLLIVINSLLVDALERREELQINLHHQH